MSGFGAMYWKETRELFWPAGRPTGMFIGGVLGAIVFGIMPHVLFLPFGSFVPSGPGSSPRGADELFTIALAASGMLYAATFSWMGVLGLAPESFAGERERHTMETLLASRLTDGEILYGKMAAIAAYGVSLAAVSVFTYILILLAFVGQGPRFLMTLVIGASSLVGAVPLGLMLLLVGILISLKAKTVKGANQAMALAIMPVIFLPMVLLFSAPALLPLLGDRPGAVETASVAALVSVPLLVIGTDLLLFYLVRRAFRRDRLLAS